jgi:hypothetical protein
MPLHLILPRQYVRLAVKNKTMRIRELKMASVNATSSSACKEKYDRSKGSQRLN